MPSNWPAHTNSLGVSSRGCPPPPPAPILEWRSELFSGTSYADDANKKFREVKNPQFDPVEVPRHVPDQEIRQRNLAKLLAKKKSGVSSASELYIVQLRIELFPYQIDRTDKKGRQLITEEGLSLQEVVETLVEENGGAVVDIWEDVIAGFSVELSHNAAKKLGENPYIKSVEVNSVLKTQSTENNQWGLDRIDQKDDKLDPDFISEDFIYHQTGKGVHVYVVDTGIHSSHQEFWDVNSNGVVRDSNNNPVSRVLTGVDPTSASTLLPFGSSLTTNDNDGHGTHVAGLIAGITTGVAKLANLVPIKVQNSVAKTVNYQGTTADELDIYEVNNQARLTVTLDTVVIGLNWIKANYIRPAVVNISLLSEAPQEAIDDAVLNLINENISVVVAGGNGNKSVASYSPARVSTAIRVGATGTYSPAIDSGEVISPDKPATVSYFTNISSPDFPIYKARKLELSATGVDIYAPGVFLKSSTIDPNNSGSNEGYAINSGTSQAAALVSGAVAQILEINPFASPAQVKKLLTDKATPVNMGGTLKNQKVLYTPDWPQIEALTSTPPELYLERDHINGLNKLVAKASESNIIGLVLQSSTDLTNWKIVKTIEDTLLYYDEPEPVGGSIFYRAAARSSTSLSAFSSPMFVSSLPSISRPYGSPPSPPTNLEVSPYMVNFSPFGIFFFGATLNWDDNSNNETHFRVERKASHESTWTEVISQGANGTSINYQNSGMSCQAYDFRVVAVNAYGSSYASNSDTLYYCSTPITPTSVSITPHTVALWPGYPPLFYGVTIYWTDNSDNESGFRIERRLAGSSTWTQIATTNGDVDEYYLSDSSMGCQDYEFRVIALNGSIESDPSVVGELYHCP